MSSDRSRSSRMGSSLGSSRRMISWRCWQKGRRVPLPPACGRFLPNEGDKNRPAALRQAPAKRIALVDDEHRLRCDVGIAADFRPDRSVHNVDGTVKHGAHDAFLPPVLSFGELAIFEQAGQLCAGARAAGRAAVRLAKAKNEIPASSVAPMRRPEEGHRIDLFALRSGNAVANQRLTK